MIHAPISISFESADNNLIICNQIYTKIQPSTAPWIAAVFACMGISNQIKPAGAPY